MNHLAQGFRVTMMLLALAGTTWAGSGYGFQTDVAVSGDGERLATCRERVLYILDAASLKVTHRFWNEGVVHRLALSRDGSVLAVTDDAKRLRLLDIAKGEFLKKSVSDISSVAYAPAQDMAAVTVWRGQPNAYDLLLLSITDGSELARVKLPDGFCPHRLVLHPDGGRVVLISAPNDSPEEKAAPDNPPEKSASNLVRKEYKQRHDGKTATILTLELPSGKELSRTETWYTAHSYARELLFFAGDDVYIMQYQNPCAKIDGQGVVTLFQSAAGCNYGLGWSVSGDVHLEGSMAKGYYCRVGQAPIEFSIARNDRLPGWPEYFFGFGVRDDGTAYGVTGAGRIAEISSSGNIVRIVPFF